MTRVIHIDELCRPADNSPLFSCQYLSLILLVTILYPSIHYQSTHYSLSKHPLFPIGARHIAIFKLSHQLPSQNKEIFRLRGDCPWIRQSPLSLFLSILGNSFLSYILSFLRLPCRKIVLQNQPQEFFSRLTLCTTFFCRDVVIMER